ncbi:MAG TPA: peptide-methionine (S)-S-oxide reductase MsrA [Vicinamibacterales bacterium]|nr:peptide-methionine (S)-S-oxide reductase MsrA [Vicinamibacterales bacterium]
MRFTASVLAIGVALVGGTVVHPHLFTAAGAGVAGASAAFPEASDDEPLAPQSGRATIVVAGGCFWGVQAVFQHTKGVLTSTSGYAGGNAKNPSYELVSSGTTGHAESVQVVYDPSQISLGRLLKVFFSVAHDPTELNRQGPDEGTQYRSMILATGDRQTAIARAYIAQLDASKIFHGRIVTDVVPLRAFYPAEGYHQDYVFRHPYEPYIMINDRPKVENLKKRYPDLYVEKRSAF